MRRLLLSLGLVLCATHPSYADSIQIRGGALTGFAETSSVTLFSDRFTFHGQTGIGVFPASGCQGCGTGFVLTPEATWTGENVVGFGTVDGVPFNLAHPLVTGLQLFFTAGADPVWGTPLPTPQAGDVFTVTGAFLFGGIFTSQVGIIHHQLIGSGMATLGFRGVDSGNGTASWDFAPEMTAYRFADSNAVPVPEPGTLLLLGPALLGLWRRRSS
jgi:hypothetical protein